MCGLSKTDKEIRMTMIHFLYVILSFFFVLKTYTTEIHKKDKENIGTDKLCSVSQILGK